MRAMLISILAPAFLLAGCATMAGGHHAGAASANVQDMRENCPMMSGASDQHSAQGIMQGGAGGMAPSAQGAMMQGGQNGMMQGSGQADGSQSGATEGGAQMGNHMMSGMPHQGATMNCPMAQSAAPAQTAPTQTPPADPHNHQ